MNRRIHTRFACLLLALVLLVSLVGCSSGREVRASSRAVKTVATAGNIEIRYDELYYLAMTRLAELREEHEGDAWDDDAVRAELTAFVEQNLLIRQHALFSLAAEYGVDHERGEVADNIESWMESVIEDNFDGDRKAYINSLNESYLTDHYVRTFIAAEDYVGTEIIKELLAREEISDSDEAALETVERDFIRTVQVLIKKNNGKDDATNRTIAESIAMKLAAITDDTARYLAMCQEIGGAYNNDYSDTLGNGYYFTKGEMDPAYEKAAFDLPLWGTSGVIETEDGYYVIMRLPQDETYVKENLNTLKSQIYFAELNTRVERRYEELQASFAMTEYGESLDLLSLPTIDANGGETVVTVITVVVIVIALGGAAWAIAVLQKRHKAKRK